MVFWLRIEVSVQLLELWKWKMIIPGNLLYKVHCFLQSYTCFIPNKLKHKALYVLGKNLPFASYKFLLSLLWQDRIKEVLIKLSSKLSVCNFPLDTVRTSSICIRSQWFVVSKIKFEKLGQRPYADIIILLL